MMKASETQRGFAIVEFTDSEGVECSLQKSSNITEDLIWLGCTDANPQHLVKGLGWKPYPLPESVQMTTRMHLTQEQVVALLPMLEHFAYTGELPPREGLDGNECRGCDGSGTINDGGPGPADCPDCNAQREGLDQ